MVRAEHLLARTAAGGLVLLAVPVLAGAWLVQGRAGMYGAAAGLGLVFVLFVAAGVVHARAARFSPGVFVAVVLGGLAVRLALYLGALAVLGRVDGLHRPSLAIATAIAFVLTLILEMRLVIRTPGFFWVEPDKRRALEGAAR